jgi:hypothetical protein
MSENEKKGDGMPYAIGAVLGVGVGAAVGVAIGDLGTGIWIGSTIGVGLAMLANYLRR